MSSTDATMSTAQAGHKRTASELDASSAPAGEKIGLAGVDLNAAASSGNPSEPPAKKAATDSAVTAPAAASTSGFESLKSSASSALADAQHKGSALMADVKPALNSAAATLKDGAHKAQAAIEGVLEKGKAAIAGAMHKDESATTQSADKLDTGAKEPSLLEKGQAALTNAGAALSGGLKQMEATVQPLLDQAAAKLHLHMGADAQNVADKTTAGLKPSTESLKAADKSADASHSVEKSEGALPGERNDDEFPNGKHETQSDAALSSSSAATDGSATKGKRASRGSASKKANAAAAGDKQAPIAVDATSGDVINA